MNGRIISGKKLMSIREIGEYKAKHGLDATLKIDPRLRFLRNFGSHSLAYSTLQDDLDYFFMYDVGYVAFKRFGSILTTTNVLGDPIVAQEDLERMIKEFCNSFPDACFTQAGRQTAEVLHKSRSYYATRCGVEKIIDVEKFHLDGKYMADMRRYRNVCARNGLEVIESPSHELDIATLQIISQEWIRKRTINDRELSFLARSMESGPGLDVVYMVITKDSDIIGFTVFDPIYKESNIVGYQTSIQRALPDVPKGTLDYINLHMIDQLKMKGIKTLSLGWSPFSLLEHDEMESAFNFNIFKAAYNLGNNAYGFKNLEFHKDRYRPNNEPVYFCSPNRYPVKHILDVFRLCKVLNF